MVPAPNVSLDLNSPYNVFRDAWRARNDFGFLRMWSIHPSQIQPIVDAMAKVISDEGFSYALFGGGLLGFEIGAGLTARLGAGVTMEVTEVKVQDGKLVAERALAAGIKEVVFDRGGYIYHGRVKALADAAREGGLAF